jgi:hypothetical protein
VPIRASYAKLNCTMLSYPHANIAWSFKASPSKVTRSKGNKGKSKISGGSTTTTTMPTAVSTTGSSNVLVDNENWISLNKNAAYTYVKERPMPKQDNLTRMPLNQLISLSKYQIFERISQNNLINSILIIRVNIYCSYFLDFHFSF